MPRRKAAPTNIALANMSDRRDAINKAFAQILKTDDDIDSARELHIKPLTDARTALWRNLKTDTDIERADLEIYYKLFKRQHLAKTLEGDEGQRIQDNLREVFFAMQKGGQLSFLDTVEDAA